jgi:hypothetical protein
LLILGFFAVNLQARTVQISQGTRQPTSSRGSQKPVINDRNVGEIEPGQSLAGRMRCSSRVQTISE